MAAEQGDNMAQKYKASIWRKVRKWLGRKIDLTSRVSYQRSTLSGQVGKLMQSRGSEIITMTTL